MKNPQEKKYQSFFMCFFFFFKSNISSFWIFFLLLKLLINVFLVLWESWVSMGFCEWWDDELNWNFKNQDVGHWFKSFKDILLIDRTYYSIEITKKKTNIFFFSRWRLCMGRPVQQGSNKIYVICTCVRTAHGDMLFRLDDFLKLVFFNSSPMCIQVIIKNKLVQLHQASYITKNDTWNLTIHIINLKKHSTVSIINKKMTNKINCLINFVINHYRKNIFKKKMSSTSVSQEILINLFKIYCFSFYFYRKKKKWKDFFFSIFIWRIERYLYIFFLHFFDVIILFFSKQLIRCTSIKICPKFPPRFVNKVQYIVYQRRFYSGKMRGFLFNRAVSCM